MDIPAHLKDIDFSTFLDFPTACSVRNVPYAKILEDGRVSLYGDLRKCIANQQRQYRAKISSDGRCIALYTELPPNIRFHADGMSVRHEKLLQYLLDKGIQLPAVYEMEWLEDQKAWVGCCKDLPAPDISKR